MVEIHAAESQRFPGEGSSTQGKSGPKPRPKGVGDGQPVEIPVPQAFVTSEAGTQEDRRSGPLVEPVQADKGVRQANPPGTTPSGDGEGNQVPKWPNPHCREKPLARTCAPVLKPTQVGGARSLRRAGEPLLRNSAKSPRNFGRRGAPVGSQGPRGPQRNSPSDCLPKTQVSANAQAEV
jgi:hypothetical protein